MKPLFPLKQLALAIFTIFIFTLPGAAQIRFDLLGGYSPASTPVTVGLIVNRQQPREEFTFNMVKVDPQYFVGAKGHLALNEQFFAEAGLTYTLRKSTYQMDYTMSDIDEPATTHLMSETSHYLLLPVNIGFTVKNFDVTSGLRIISNLSNKSDLNHISGYASSPSPFMLGWQGGIGYYILKTRIGIEYQSSFTRVGAGQSVNGQSLELMNTGNQFVFTIQQSF
jgi:hypothetical protein